MQPFSVLMSVYRNDDALYFSHAIDSILNQTIPPAEIVLVRDGEVPKELQQTIDSYCRKHPELIRYVPLEVNGGLGHALRIGVEHAKYDLIARMDSDDIALPNRFELQGKAFEEHPAVDIIGGQITEFVDAEENIVSRRVVPTEHEDIAEYCQERSPMNHMTVMFRKSAVLNAGNYMDLYFAEDYYLWCRMLASGCLFLNLTEVLVNVRVGSAMYRRRGGWRYFCSLRIIEKYKLHAGQIGGIYFFKNVIMRFIQCLLIPGWLRGWLYKMVARK